MRKKTLALFLTCVLAAGMLAGCGNKDSKDNNQVENSQGTESAKDDQAAADEVAELIDAIYVQERTDKTDEQCAAAKEAWDKLTDAQKALVSGENADPDYFGRDTGDASKDDPLNQDNIGDNEILVVSFGTSFNDRYQWCGKGHSGSKSGLGSPQGIYRTDHYQSRTGKRWREDRQRRPGITESG